MCVEYQQGRGGGRGCHCEGMKFEFHSKMLLMLLSNCPIDNLLRNCFVSFPLIFKQYNMVSRQKLVMI